MTFLEILDAERANPSVPVAADERVARADVVVVADGEHRTFARCRSIGQRFVAVDYVGVTLHFDTVSGACLDRPGLRLIAGSDAR